MSEKLNRLKKLPSAQTRVDAKTVKIDGIAELLAELKALADANQKAQEKTAKAIENLAKTVIAAGDNGLDTQEIINAIGSLKLEVAQEPRAPMDYVVNFERDQRTGLMKSGIRFSAVPKRLN